MRMNPVFLKTLQAILVVLLYWHLQPIGSNSWRAAGAIFGCIDMERQALLEFKAGLSDNFGRLSSWGSEEEKSDCCEWEGIGCSNQSGHVEMLDLSSDELELDKYLNRYVLTGNYIHTSLMKLKHLTYLDLSWNRFRGSIPEFIGSLSNLRYLNLSGCDFAGKIPSELASLSDLQHLDLSSNQLQGTIPYQLGNLSQLLSLDLSWNYLVGRIHYQLGNLATLQKLDLGDNLSLEIGQWLPNLTSITYLGLSGVIHLNHSHTWILKIGMLPKLRELYISECYLSNNYFLSLDPLNFKFPASLTLLDLSSNSLTSSIFPWVFNVTSSLVELHLSNNEIRSNFLKPFKNISLLSLDLSVNNLNETLSTILHSLHGVRHSLQNLDLSWNQITGTLPDLSAFPCLKRLELSQNRLYGNIPEGIRFASQFESLAMNSNSLQGGIPQLFGNICTLHSLDFSNNSLSEEFPRIIHNLSGCARYSLQKLLLDDNQISGALPDLSIFPSLKSLRLSHNRLNGKIAEDDRFPSQLEDLDLSFNSLKGVIVSNSTFANLSKLVSLDLSYNSLALTFSPNWVPSFQLETISLAACKIGPEFPKWIQTQHKLLDLDISNAGIIAVVPDWFWNLQLRLDSLNISYNNLTGRIPNLPLGYITGGQINLASNQFEGSIPLFLRSATLINLSNNKFSQPLAFICHKNVTVDKLGIIDLSNNEITGQLPNCWSHFKSLVYLDLSGNNISGKVPNSLGSLSGLEALILRNNNFTGELPLSLKSCKKLQMLDVGENRLSGPIPPWIGNDLQLLQILSLRRNQFSGSLPLQLCLLTSTQVLDLSLNNLSGEILKCFKNLTSMVEKKNSFEETTWTHDFEYRSYGVRIAVDYNVIASLMWKGVERIFKDNNLILKLIDLSSNQLSGQIPAEIGNLVQLVSLNLSRNNLTGQIPSELGSLRSLDVLDLSRNHFFGRIPSSLAQINRLGVFDLSNNHLSGKIPSGTQLQSFNASSYEGNGDLCGEPLEKKCVEVEVVPELVELSEDEYSIFSRGFYISMALGFSVGFLGIFGPLIVSRVWRQAYFRMLNNLMDFMKWQQ